MKAMDLVFTPFLNRPDPLPADIKPPDGSFESGNLPTLGRYFLTFDRPGEVEYFCAIHLGMRGRIIVER